MYSKKQSHILYVTPQASHFLSSCLHLHLILWISSERLLTRFDNELATNLVLYCNMQDIFFVISSPILSIFVTSFSIGTVNVMYFSTFSPKQINVF